MSDWLVSSNVGVKTNQESDQMAKNTFVRLPTASGVFQTQGTVLIESSVGTPRH